MAESTVRFGRFVLTPGERRLDCEGRPCRLGSRSMDLLIALAQHKGQVVASAELVRRVWPTTVVSDASLRVHVVKLRKALEQACPTGADLVQNVSGRGYMLRDIDPGGHAPHSVELARLNPRSFGHLVGREALLADTQRALQLGRLVTLVAPGGMGKTSLARAVAQAQVALGRETFWVDLSALHEDAAVADEVARCLGVKHSGDALAVVARTLRKRVGLLVLDCCESAVHGAAQVAEEIVRRTPSIAVLATSREALHADGERVIRLPALDLGPLDATDLETAGAAVQLFVERAQAADASLRLPQDLARVRQICADLDGMPLAIELAAAHLVGFGLHDLSTLIKAGYQLGGLGRRTAPARQQTLESTFEWSYRLLGDTDRTVLMALSVFEGGASLRAIIGTLPRPDLDASEVSGAIARLADKSLLKVVPHQGGVYYRLLDTTRAFAARRLDAAGQAATVRQQHAEYLLSELSRRVVEGEQTWAVEWFGPCCPNIANLRVALDWTQADPSRSRLAIALALAAAPTLLQLSLHAECERGCGRALAVMGPASAVHAGNSTRLLAYQGAAVLAARGPVDESLQAMQAALELAHRAADGQSQALVLSGLFWLWMYRSRPQQAIETAERMLAVNPTDAASALLRDQCIAYASTLKGLQDEACARLQDVEARSLYLAHGQYMRIGSDPNVFLKVFLVKTLWLQGRLQAALAVYERSLESLRRPEHGLYFCWALNEVLIPLHCFRGDFRAAREAAEELEEASARQTMVMRQRTAACAAMAIELLDGAGELDEYLQAVQALRDAHFASVLPWLDGVAALKATAIGAVAVAEQILDRAIADAQDTGSHWWLPELYRLRGRALMSLAEEAPSATAERDLRAAFEMADAQGARALQLRAAIDLDALYGQHPDRRGQGLTEQSLRLAPEMAGVVAYLESGRPDRHAS